MPVWGLAVFSLGLAWLGIWRHWLRLVGVAAMLVGLASPLMTHTPDILVSDDGRLIAVRTPEGAFLQQAKGGSRFIRDAWAQFWAVKSFQMLPEDSPGAHPSGPAAKMPVAALVAAKDVDHPRRNEDARAESGAESLPSVGELSVQDKAPVICGDGACLLRPYPDRRGAMLARGERHPDFCREVSVIVSAEPARGLCPKPWPALVDRFTVWRYGSTAVWLEADGARILTDRRERGDRPWVPPPPKPRTVRPTLPPAVVDRPEAVPTESASGPAEIDNQATGDERLLPTDRDPVGRDSP